MDARRSKTIEGKSAALLIENEMFSPNFDVFRLVSELDIGCKRSNDLPSNVSGASMIKDGIRIITINETQSEKRKRFTAAHELGHILLGHDTSLNISGANQVLYRNDASSLGADWREIEANHFAACLLMPRELVEREISTSELSEADVPNLAEKFGVSSVAMSIRLSKLGYI